MGDSCMTSKTLKPSYESFDEMPLPPDLLKGIYSYGFDQPSEIQKKGIAAILTKRDCVIQSQSGTGKTATFCIGFLSNIDIASKTSQCLVVSPTRELADQTLEVFKQLGHYMQGFRVHLSRGGTSPHDDIKGLRQQPHIIVATPGRFIDMCHKRVFNSTTIVHMCLDEADELLTLGFQEQIHEIMGYLNKIVQVCLVSATMPVGAHEIAKVFMNDPIKLLINDDELTLEGISQYFVNVGEYRHKFDTLMDIYQRVNISQAIIYCNKRRDAECLAERLQRERFTVACFHGEMSNGIRSKIINQFRAGVVRVLVTTDLLARGIDVQQVSLVLNYDLSKDVETYIHRIGRSGRFGRKGVAINLATSREVSILQDIEQFYETRIHELPENIEDVFSS